MWTKYLDKIVSAGATPSSDDLSMHEPGPGG